MSYHNRRAKINVKFLVILILITVALGTSLVAARQIRRNILSKVSLTAGEAAFASKDWPAAYENLREYLARNPDDMDILKKCAKARLSMRPLEPEAVAWAISAYRLVLRQHPLDEVAYEQLVKLYTGTQNFDELAYITRARLDHVPDDRQSPLWLADALIQQNKPDEAIQVLEQLMGALEPLAEKRVEYMQACVRMSGIVARESGPSAKTKALEWLNKAVSYDPNCAEARAYRARFYRLTPQIPGVSASDRLSLARRDLEMADAAGTDDPKMRYFLGTEWAALGHLDRAAIELQAIDRLSLDTIEKQYFDINDWKTARFLFASELAARRGAAAEAAALADEALATLTETRHRVQALPTAITAYVTAGKAQEAHKCLDEYVGILRSRGATAETRLKMAWLQALVARAEERFYLLIDTLQPVVVNETSHPELWRLLAEAYSRTDQPRRAVDALVRYLRSDPQNPEMMLQLTREYLRLRDWNKAFEAARLAEPLRPMDTVVKLLRIEASVYVTAEQPQEKVDTAKLQEYSAELSRLRQEHPADVDIRLLQALVANYLGQPDKAESELKQAIQECKDPLRAEMELARHYYRHKRMADAIAAYRASCKNHSELAEPWVSLSNLYVANEDYSSARDCLREGLKSVVGTWEERSVSMALGLLEITHGDRAAGIQVLNELIASRPDEVRARSLLLSTREVQQDRAASEKLIAELRQAEGESGRLWRLHQASLWLSSDDWRSKQAEVTNLLQYCIDSDPEWSSPVLLLAGMYEKLGDARRAEDVCRQALVRNPSATDVTDKLLALLENQGRFSDAERVLAEMETNPQVAGTWRIRMAMRSGDFARAIEELKLRASNDARDANSRIQLARLVYWQTKDVDQALGYLKEAEATASDLFALTGVKASILRAEGRAAEVQQLLDDYVAGHGDFNAHLLRASNRARDGQFELAESDYKKLTSFADNGAAGYLLLGNFYAGNKRIDQAIASLEEGSNIYPADSRLKRRTIQLLLLRGQPQDRQRADEILTAMEQQLPHDPELLQFRALCLLAEPGPQSVRAARGKLEEAVKLEPTAVEGHLLLIGMAMEAGEYENARDSAIRALGANPNNAALLTVRSKAELALKNPRIALDLVHLALQADPNNTDVMDVLVGIGVSEEDNKVLKEALTRIEAGLARHPQDEKLMLLRTRTLTAIGMSKQGIPELEAYCRTEDGSHSVAALVRLADLYRLAGDVDRAGQCIERARQVDPSSQTVVHARLLWLVAQKRWGDLANISSEYLSAKPQDVTLVRNAALVLAASDSIEMRKEAVKLFEQAIALSPLSIDARLGLGSCLYQTGEAERAEKTYRGLLSEYPNDTRILNDLAWILQEHYHQYAEALTLADKGLNLAPDDVHLLDTRGTILSNTTDRLADAKKDFERLVALSSGDTERQAKALLQLGRVCAKLNELPQAKEHLERALQIDRRAGVFTQEERSEITRIVQRCGT
ncbi:MAG: tetratricopeptide repeat protein [Sedimentisphaerales bacterium]|nr:tetratricopeptide repeat protein [Sedimentisphaerales bacterium]